MTITEIKDFPLQLMMGYQPGCCLNFCALNKIYRWFVSQGDTEEVAVVVLRLSDLGNYRIKASFSEYLLTI